MPQADFVSWAISWAAVLAVSAGLSAALILVLKPLLIRHLLAQPNARSSHATPTPQGAGLAVMASVLAVMAGVLLLGLAVPPPNLLPVLIGAAAFTVIGALDDAHALAVSWRLVAQLLVAAAVIFLLPQDFRLLPDMLPASVERVLLVIGVVGFVNAVNFLDGLDWMTVAQVVPMTLGVAILTGLGAVPASIGLLALALLGATLGFAAFNKHPAQIFLGDAGSLPIGLLLAFLLIVVAEAHLVSGLLLALYTLSEAAITFFRRLFAGEPVLSAHKSHFYQRAVEQGLRVPQVTLRVFTLGLWLMVLAVVAALSRSLTADLILLALGLVATGLVLFNLGRGR
jgi:UDP-N-acetylmuramyl pentapeptide phosphotransferase/UDP-N-acetylglucosamine-1-phosphate transferase